MYKFNVEFSMWEETIDNAEFEIYDDGTIFIGINDAWCKTSIDELDEVIRQSKMFRSGRIVYKKNKKLSS